MVELKIKLYWEMSEAEIDRIYEAGKADRALSQVSSEAQMNSEMFSLFARRMEVFGAGYDMSGNILGFFYLTHFEGASARLHLCFYQAGRKERHKIGRQVMKWCFDTFEFKCLIGAVPVIYEGACKYALEVGGRELGAVPDFCWLEQLKRNVGARIFVFEP